MNRSFRSGHIAEGEVTRLSLVESAARPELLCYHHGSALYLCALMMTGDRGVAVNSAADAIVRVGSSPGPTADLDSLAMRRELSSLVFGDCRGRPRRPPERWNDLPSSFDHLAHITASTARHQREALALCVYGGHSASQAATLLGIDADSAYRLLSWGLRDLAGHIEGSDHPASPS